MMENEEEQKKYMLNSHEEDDTIIINVDEEENEFRVNADEKEEEEDQKNNGGEDQLGESNTWVTLHDDILELITSNLHPVDYIHFRVVCKPFQSVIPAFNRRSTSSNEIIPTTNMSPWLVFILNEDGGATICNFIDPMHNNEKYLMNLPELFSDAKIRFSKDGWLLMSSGEVTLFFFNPFTRAMIQLPNLKIGPVYQFSGFSFSSSPTSSDCAVFATLERKDFILGFYISRGSDQWNYYFYNNTKFLYEETLRDLVPYHNNPVSYFGAFYYLELNGALGCFNIRDDNSWNVHAHIRRPCNCICQSFLVECEGELLSVYLGLMGKWVRIFKMDFATRNWVEIKSLGKYTLFVSSTSCLSVIAPSSRMENKIYFPRLHGEGIVFYSFDTGRYHSHGSQLSAKDFYDTKEQSNCSWIEPNWSQTTDQELDWLRV